MELKQIAPWNWFKKEEENQGSSLPVLRRGSAPDYPASLARFHDDFDQIFENFLQGFPLAPTLFPRMPRPTLDHAWLRPSVDIAASDKEYTITVEIPGVDEKQITVELSGDTLLIRGEKELRKEENKKDYHCVECSYGAFQRQLSLPEDADPEAIKAAYKQGVLTLTVPRRAAARPTPKQIDVHAA
jgi:HSP20 family protein